MFDKYDNLNPNYIPNNIYIPTPICTDNDELPKKVYSLKNTFLGYSWYYGDKFNFILKHSHKQDSFNLDLYNFKWEKLKSYKYLDSKDINVPVDEDFYTIFKPGAYYAVLRGLSKDTFLVVDKFYIIIN